MITPEDVIAEARSWKGTPFLHQGRSARGVDCVGLVIVTLQKLGCLSQQFESPEYGRVPKPGELRRKIEGYCKSLAAPVPGAMVGFRFIGNETHVGIYTGENIIHAYQKRRQVIEHSFRGKWLERVTGCWALPGVSY